MIHKESYDYLSSEPIDHFTSKILNKINAFACIIDIHNEIIIWANSHFITTIGFSQSALSNVSVDKLLWLIHPDYREVAINELKLLNNTDFNNQCGLIKVRSKNKNWTWVLATCIAHEKKASGQINKILFFAREVNIQQLYHQLTCIQDTSKANQTIKIAKLLSEREKKVIELICNGYSDREISEYLGISIHTAKTHRKRIIHKMGLKNSSTLIKYAVENGLSTQEFPL